VGIAGAQSLNMQQVFVLQGVPQHTFVQPSEYTRLLVALQTPGRSVVVEGPSGIGKTTSVVKAINEAGLDAEVVLLSGRKTEDVAFISELPSQLPVGTVIIDDFHRLNHRIQRVLADLMKTLADEGAGHSKIVVLGIPNAGQTLISFGKDLANRIEIIQLEANPENKIEEVLSRGEAALNVSINVKEQIVSAAQGSFYLAQMLAYHTCIKAGVLSTCENKCETAVSFESVRAVVMAQLARSFHETTIAFARGTKLRPEGRAPYLHLLYWLSQSKNWSINTRREADRHPEQRGSVSQVVTKGFLKDLIEASTDIQRVLHFDGNTLVAQDPQFIFYIRNLSWPALAEEVGFLSMEFPSRYDFALSFAGADREIAQALFFYLQEQELEVFYDLNEQHRILAADVEEYLAPIYSSDAQLVVCILGPDYPKRIWTKFESAQFKQRFKAGQVIPIVLDTVELGVFDEATKVGYVSWDTKADLHAQVETVGALLVRTHREVRSRKDKSRDN
jgi:hypothetical protein